MVVAFTLGTTAGVTATEVTPNSGYKIVTIGLPSTFRWSVDSIVVDLTTLGGHKLAGWAGFCETTAGSIVVPELLLVTSVSAAGVATITTGAAADHTGVSSLMLLIYG